MSRKTLFAMVGLAVACGIPACDDGGPGGPSETWRCNVTLTLVPSTIGSRRSPQGSGRGSGTGSTRDQALSSALAEACEQLDLDSATARRCRSGADFQVEGGGSGNVRLFSAVERSVNCRTL